MQYGTFEKSPKLKIVVFEVGAGWASYSLDRMDAVYDSVIGRTLTNWPGSSTPATPSILPS
jgi:hypothetical protein